MRRFGDPFVSVGIQNGLQSLRFINYIINIRRNNISNTMNTFKIKSGGFLMLNIPENERFFKDKKWIG